MSADKIIEKIISKAEEDVLQMEKEANKQVEATLLSIERQTERTLNALKNKEKADVEEIHRRSQLMTRLDSRKNALAIKRKVIDEAFNNARLALDNLDNTRYEALITKIILEGVETGNEQVQVPKADIDKYKNGLLDKLNSTLKAVGKTGNLTLLETPAAIKSGILLIGEKSDINGSFDVLIQDARDKYERKVAEILFEVGV